MGFILFSRHYAISLNKEEWGLISLKLQTFNYIIIFRYKARTGHIRATYRLCHKTGKILYIKRNNTRRDDVRNNKI